MTTQVDSGVRQRTRRAILDAAAAAWARDWSTSLGDIADRAEVSRSTLHRYFPERQALVDALLIDAQDTLERLWTGATAASGSPIESIENIMIAIAEEANRIVFLFSDPSRFAGNPNWRADDDTDDMVDLVRAAQADGTVDSDIDAEFTVGIVYSLVYVAAEAAASGRMPRHKAAEYAVRTFRHGLSPRHHA
ncbi:TetR/AcrR family transcriptional regulator [Jiangella asiatica]|uniref:TetR/AcrR family transcriptional regulator n=1 Tax=Jiangella asiatica TaxID=2530372 RepID=A0A4R5DAI0_9ACTN|nr:TetR/AcrR family transcriptional regulator [Jiangella asiatica]TDE10636.1 TetR/AcrR family transcriptional regulator [Jiangella asiatica]